MIDCEVQKVPLAEACDPLVDCLGPAKWHPIAEKLTVVEVTRRLVRETSEALVDLSALQSQSVDCAPRVVILAVQGLATMATMAQIPQEIRAAVLVAKA
jgi:hypothetical protein